MSIELDNVPRVTPITLGKFEHLRPNHLEVVNEQTKKN